MSSTFAYFGAMQAYLGAWGKPVAFFRQLRVSFTLQGDADRLDKAVAVIREGAKKSSELSKIKVTTTPGTVDPALNNFTIVDWTSTSRNITDPYELVFNLRPKDNTLSKADVQDVWHGILKSTLKGDDWKKLRDED